VCSQVVVLLFQFCVVCIMVDEWKDYWLARGLSGEAGLVRSAVDYMYLLV
jgi:hypothetical protein